MTIRSLKEIRNKHCKECSFSENSEKVCLSGYGSDKAKIMIIGDSLQITDKNHSGKPFIRKAESLLDIILSELNLKKKNLFLTGIIRCPIGRDQKITIHEMRACREYLDREIKIVKPKIIICLGNTALKGLFDSNLMGIKRERGNILEYKGIKVIVTYGPYAGVKNQYFGKLIYQDLEQGLERAQETDTLPCKTRREELYSWVTTKNRSRAKKDLMGSPKITLDVETEGLDMFDLTKELLCVGITNGPNKGWIYHTTEEDLEDIQEIVNSVGLVGNHNIKFDLKWLLRYGIKIRKRIFCTQTALHLLDENYPDKSLEHLVKRELKGDIVSYMNHWKKATGDKWKAGEPVTLEELKNRNGGDIDATFQIMEIYSKALEREGLTKLMKFEMRNLKVLTYMEFQGVKIDQKNYKLLKKQYEDKIEDCKFRLKRLLGDINLNSPTQLRNKLFEELNLPIIKRTPPPANQPSTDEDTLIKLSKLGGLNKEVKNVLNALLEHRNVDKLYNTYITSLTKKGLMKSDGRVHPNFKIFGTVTGRLSCTKPNLQQIPREGDIKLMFTSGFKNGVIIQGDYSQAELRILAHYSKDKALIQAFRSGRDIHQEVAAKVFRKDYDKVTPQERKFTKQVNFGIVYLISVKGLAEKLNCSETRSQRLINDWFKEFPEAKKWINKTKMKVVDYGYTENIFGRKRRFFGTDPNTSKGRENQRQGVNAPIQGGAGDLTKWVGTKLYYEMRKKGLEAKLIINVHDAVMVDSPKKEAKHVIKLMRNIAINPPIELLVPLVMDIKMGPNWGELIDIKGKVQTDQVWDKSKRKEGRGCRTRKRGL